MPELDKFLPDTFETYDEAQPFLQFLADLLNRLIREQAGSVGEIGEPVERAEEIGE